MSFEITSPSVVHRGIGTFGLIADEVARRGGRAAVVTGGHMVGSLHLNRLVSDLRARSVNVFVCEPVISEPTVGMVDLLASSIRENACEVVAAIGGGSAMDCAKAAAMMATNDGLTEDYQLRRREISVDPLPMVFAPTTAGTGSESTRVSVLTNVDAGVKRSISHPRMVPEAVALDPELTVTCNRRLTTLSAMDALAHAIESAVSLNADSYTRHVALAAVEEVAIGLRGCLQDPADLDARLSCLVGSCLAGLAMQAGLGASHSLAPAVCIVGSMSHSEAVVALLPHALRLNEERSARSYDEVRRAIGSEDPAKTIEELCASGGVGASLAAYGLSAADWPRVLEAMNRYASHRRTNPVAVTDEWARELYTRSLSCKP